MDMRSNRSRLWVSPLLTGLAFAYLGCGSDDSLGDKSARTTSSTTSGSGSTSSGSNGAGGASTSGSNTTSSAGTGSNTTSAGTGSNTSTTGNGGASATTGNGGSGGGATTGGTGGAGSGTGGARDAGNGGSANRDAGIVDAHAEADVPLPVCNYPNWVAGMAYKANDIVMYMGKAYIALGDNPGLDPTVSTFYWAPYTGCKPPPPPPPTKCAVLDALLPNGEATFTQMFTPSFQGWVPLAAYSYASLCQALSAAGVAGFVRSGNMTQDKRELAAFFANVAIETAYLTFTDEGGQPSTAQDYHGRGALQITGQPIYQEVGSGLGLALTQTPGLASQAPHVWSTGIWYWMNHANPSVGSPNICHNAIAQGNFGLTVRIIQGSCGSAPDRITQYQKNCTLLSVDPGTTTCQ
jgi:chitinase